MTDDEVSWLLENSSTASCAQIPDVGHFLHLQDKGQAPVLEAMMALLAEI